MRSSGNRLFARDLPSSQLDLRPQKQVILFWILDFGFSRLAPCCHSGYGFWAMEQKQEQKKEPLEYYLYSSTGIIQYDPKKEKASEPFWGIVQCDPEIIRYYRWLLLRQGMDIQKGSLWGAHITWNRGEEPPHKSLWGKYEGAAVEFRYTNYLRWDNGRHVWLDVYCPPLNRLREELGLEPLPQMSFHLTIGRLVIPKLNVKVLADYPYKD